MHVFIIFGLGSISILTEIVWSKIRFDVTVLIIDGATLALHTGLSAINCFCGVLIRFDPIEASKLFADHFSITFVELTILLKVVLSLLGRKQANILIFSSFIWQYVHIKS